MKGGAEHHARAARLGAEPTYEGLKVRLKMLELEDTLRAEPTYEGLKEVAEAQLLADRDRCGAYLRGIESTLCRFGWDVAYARAEPTYEGLKGIVGFVYIE